MSKLECHSVEHIPPPRPNSLISGGCGSGGRAGQTVWSRSSPFPMPKCLWGKILTYMHCGNGWMAKTVLLNLEVVTNLICKYRPFTFILNQWSLTMFKKVKTNNSCSRPLNWIGPQIFPEPNPEDLLSSVRAHPSVYYMPAVLYHVNIMLKVERKEKWWDWCQPSVVEWQWRKANARLFSITVLDYHVTISVSDLC